MKKSLLLLSLIIITITVFSQSRPQKKIRKAFELRQPEAKDVVWTGEGERYKNWTADYLVGADTMRTKYDSKANWLLTYKLIPISQLPEKVYSSVLNNYQGAKILKAAEMQEPDFDGYGVAFIYLGDRWGVAITNEGKVHRREVTSSGFGF